MEPYVTELLEAVSVKLRDCLEKSIMSCSTRGCTCPLRLQIKVGCWNSDVHGQDSDPESDHPEDISWETPRPCKIIELRGLLGQFENRSVANPARRPQHQWALSMGLSQTALRAHLRDFSGCQVAYGSIGLSHFRLKTALRAHLRDFSRIRACCFQLRRSLSLIRNGGGSQMSCLL